MTAARLAPEVHRVYGVGMENPMGTDQPFAEGDTVLYKPIYAKRARRYKVVGYHADGRVKLYYSSPMARGGQYVGRTTFAKVDQVRSVG